MTKMACDKCGEEIKEYARRAIVAVNYDSEAKQRNRHFDLCDECRKEFDAQVASFLKTKSKEVK